MVHADNIARGKPVPQCLFRGEVFLRNMSGGVFSACDRYLNAPSPTFVELGADVSHRRVPQERPRARSGAIRRP